MASAKIVKSLDCRKLEWSERQDLNLRPPVPQIEFATNTGFPQLSLALLYPLMRNGFIIPVCHRVSSCFHDRWRPGGDQSGKGDQAMKLTKREVDGLEPRERRYTVFDSELKGFGVRVAPTGQKSWIVEYRPGAGGRGVAKRRMTLPGQFSSYTPDQARKAAAKILAQVRTGGDPADVRTKERGTLRLSEVFNRYLADEVAPKRKKSTADLYRWYLTDLAAPLIGNRKITDVTRADVARLHREIGAKRQVTANRVLATLSGVYTFAQAEGLVPKGMNPCRERIEWFPEQSRERYLLTEELARLGEALRLAEGEGLPWRPDPTKKIKHAPREENRRVRFDQFAIAAIRLLLFTGCRLREILHLRWREVDLENGLLHLPDSKTGRKVVILGAPAAEILAGLPRVGEFVIAGKTKTEIDQKGKPRTIERPRADLSRPWTRIRAHAGLDDLRIHDLRHSFASVGTGAGMGLPIIGKLLGHKQVATTQRYAHLDADPVRRASNAIGATIAAALGAGGATAEVIDLKKKA